MRHRLHLWLAPLLLLSGCSLPRVLQPAQDHIPGHYRYDHSWDYNVKGLKCHCDETGTLEFRADGTTEDHAVQTHTVISNGDTARYTFRFICHGGWKVTDGKFVFAEYPEGFVLDLTGSQPQASAQDTLPALIRAANTPQTVRWIQYDITKLTRHAFTWSYTYPDGHTDYWEMIRAR